MNHAARENTEHAYIGRPVRRTEDSKLLQGKGSFVDDLKIPGVLHMAVLRSPHAHARIVAIDTSQASAMEGVFMVWTEADLPPAAREPMPILVPNPAIRQLRAQRVLACGEVCAVGDPVAFVVAQNRYLAEDACDRIVVEYEELPVASNALESLKPGSPTAHLGAPDNLAAHVTMGFGDVAAAFEGQCVRVKETFWQNRGSAHPMETRGYLAELHPSTGELTVWSSGQAPHLEKKSLIELLAWDPEKLRVIMLDVGGGFGPKAMFYPEEAMVCVAACALGRPVKWIEDRREHFLTATQERDQWWTIEVAFENDGCIRGVRLEMVHDNGAWLPWGIIMPWISVTTTPGPYVIPAMSVDLQVVFTNKGPTSPVRGAGRPQAVFAMERILDRGAHRLGIDRAELRKRNFIQPKQMPYEVGFIYRDGKPMRYDSGDYPQTQAAALERADYAGFTVRQRKARAEGRFIGIGLANYVEGTGLGPFEGATVRIQQNGRISVLTGASPQGQGHKTTFAQICADQLGVPLDLIDVVTADTSAVSMGIGTFASRITVTAGNSVYLASQNVRVRILKLAAFLMSCDPELLELSNSRVTHIGEPAKSMGLAELARFSQGMPGFSLPEGMKAGLEDTQYFSPTQSTFCNGTAVVELEVDVDIGQIRILNYVMAHDCGNLINPMIVDGQIQGAVAHGIGNATLEWMQYDEQGQPITTNFGEYLLPMATDVPRVQAIHLESPSPLNPLGVKGAGEGGTIPAAAAIISAMENALQEYGVSFTHSPLVPEQVWSQLRDAQAYAGRRAGGQS
ncbi:xanthine dehydrogenase family protein molybdopterin-binding subunit [Variovorax sp. RA8]|uniref:xanthine dehydrogenase family protein molybdopterin-binding subunit n=1 Tax=Variovorax sp. (strain JCM 16519 / RA8) TaxID=662548 RepID=UPI001317895F|nr:xanthine dehydrogenase family protein molybdopterin-binding subunit [Variovorax sp. RA8]VTU28707.1 Caffeine dehydrogenase subunit alpha [Variovorax sp. RA8]